MPKQPKRTSSAKKSPDNWKMSIYVPQTEIVEDEEVKPGITTELHSRGGIAKFFLGEEKQVEASEVKDQWRQTIVGIVSTVGEWTDASSGKWKIDEVSFGLTLSAEGRLLFIAKAGARASVQVKVKRASQA
jgi:hypothetical protein